MGPLALPSPGSLRPRMAEITVHTGGTLSAGPTTSRPPDFPPGPARDDEILAKIESVVAGVVGSKTPPSA